MAIDETKKSFQFLSVMTRNSGVIYNRYKSICKDIDRKGKTNIDYVLEVLPLILEDKQCEKAISRIVAVVVEKKETNISLVDIFKAINEIFGDEELGNEVFTFLSLLGKAGESLNDVTENTITAIS